MSFLTKIKDSFLPSFTQNLPEPQLFVDLRRIDDRSNIQNEKIYKNQIKKNYDDPHQNLLPTRIPPFYEESSKVGNEKMKRYMNDLREKIKTMYKEDQKGDDKHKQEIEPKMDFGEKVNKSHVNVDDNLNLHEGLVKKNLLNEQNDKKVHRNKGKHLEVVSNKEIINQRRRIDVKDAFKKDTGHQNRRIDLDDVIKKVVKYQNKKIEIPSEESRFKNQKIEFDDVSKLQNRRIDLDDKDNVLNDLDYHGTPVDQERVYFSNFLLHFIYQKLNN